MDPRHNVIPAQPPDLLSLHPRRQRHHDVRLKPSAFGCIKQRLGLLEC
jgi:hypothetical protein